MSKSDLNILIRDLPDEADRTINTLATLRGKRKWEVVREALIEYHEKHRSDIARLTREK